MPTVQISAPTVGLEGLAARGLAVALSGLWSAGDAAESLVGLWLSNHLRLADLTGGAVKDDPDGLLVTLGGGDRSGSRAELAASLRAGWEALRVALPADKRSTVDPVNVSVTHTAETGDTGWLAALAIVAGAAVASWAVYRAADVVSEVLLRREDARQLAADLAKLDQLAAAHVAAETQAGRSLSLDPITRAQVETLTARSKAVTANWRRPSAPLTWADWLPLAALFAGGVVLWRIAR